MRSHSLALELAAPLARIADAVVAGLARAGLALVDVTLDAAGVDALGTELALNAVARAARGDARALKSALQAVLLDCSMRRERVAAFDDWKDRR